MKSWIYADNAATTPLSDAALSAMLPWLTDKFANPSTSYGPGVEARRALETARAQAAAALNCAPEEFFFTSGGTESDNWALRGMFWMGAQQGRCRIVTSAFEHPAVLKTAQALQEEGAAVTRLPVSAEGLLSPTAVQQALQKDTAVCSVMLANNEVGTIQPVAKLTAVCHAAGVPFHTDAVQAVGHIPVDVQALGADLLSLSGHKFGGPKGTGGLYIRRGLQLPALLTGGGQEHSKRSGTENVAGAVGMAAALQDAVQHLQEHNKRTAALRNRLRDGLLSLPGTRLNGSRTQCLPGTLNISFAGVRAVSLALLLAEEGICVSTGSACSTGARQPSHVLKALGLTDEEAYGALRLSVSERLSDDDVSHILQTVSILVKKLRN